MASLRVTVTPDTFTLVDFDPDRIAALAAEVASKVGLTGDITIEVDQTTPLGRTRVVSVDPVVVNVQSGAFEDAKRLRQLSERSAVDVLGRLFHRVKDRLDPRFADAPADGDLTLAQATAWDTYAVGRCERLGYHPSKPRRLYHFRNRHGFTDVADQAFERLWSAPAGSLSWADIQAMCDQTAAIRV
ncbi:MAG TPA: hypothetical protein VFA94_10490 [Acidimicrobiales bacterium]|nr:hypothetical protein [Acidimicrobiales bacterium]